MKTTLLVAAGGAFGSVLRYWLGTWMAVQAGAAAWGTLLVNVTGSAAIGFLHAALREDSMMRPLIMIGLLGGYTTFSAFSLQTLELAQRGHVGFAMANVAVSIILCLLGVWLGFLAGRAIS